MVKQNATPSPKEAPASDALRREFADWLVDPFKSGGIGEWAEAHGVDRVTLWRWRSHPDVLARMAEWREMLRPHLGASIANIVRISLATTNAQAAVAAARLLTEVYGLAEPKQVDMAVSERRVSYASPNALREYVAQLDAAAKAGKARAN